MTSFCGTCLPLILLLETFVVFSNCAYVQFFTGENYQNLLHELRFDSNDTSPKDIPQIKIPHTIHVYDIRSIKTDVCIMMISNINYKVTESVRVDKSTPNFPARPYYYGEVPRNFYICNRQREGGIEVDVDVLKDYFQPAELEYRDVCGCQNIPISIHDLPWVLLINHGNCLEIFSEQNCPKSNLIRQIPAGQHMIRATIFKDERFRSFRPCNATWHCLKLYATVYKFEFFNNTISNATREDDEVISFDSKFVNDDPGVRITKKYKVSKEITNTIETTVSSSLSNMHKVEVDAGVKVSVGGEIPIIKAFKFDTEYHLNFKYEYQRTDTESKANRTVETKKLLLEIEETLQIPPCTEYTVSSYVKTARNVPIPYHAWVKVKGEQGHKLMTVDEIKEFLDPTLKYEGEYDANTAIVRLTDSMIATYGIQTIINGKGRKIPGCSDPDEKVKDIEIKDPIDYGPSK